MRLVVVHPATGQRMSVDEALFDHPAGHPLNNDHVEITEGEDPRPRAARQGSDRTTLKREGWVPDGMLDPETGQERALPKGYRWKPRKADD